MGKEWNPTHEAAGPNTLCSPTKVHLDGKLSGTCAMDGQLRSFDRPRAWEANQVAW